MNKFKSSKEYKINVIIDHGKIYSNEFMGSYYPGCLLSKQTSTVKIYE